MIWVRKFGVFILAIILFIAVLATTYATSLVIALNQPSTIKGWVVKSGVYDHALVAFLNNNSSSSDNNSAISISDPQVQTAAQSAFNSQAIQNGFETFIDSNFNWLSGKSNKPDFKIDLTEPKKEFGNQVQSKVKSFLSGLAVCTPQQTAALQGQLNVKLFSLTCRPANINPDSEAARAKEQVMSADFLSNPVITASTLSNNNGSQVYYVKYSKAPSLYREARFIPLILLAITVALSLLVTAASTTREKGKKNVAIVLFVASFMLIVGKVIAELVRMSQKIQWFNVEFSKDLNKPLNDLVNIAISSISTTDLVIAIILVIIGVLLIRSARKSDDIKPKPRASKPNKKETVIDENPIYFEDEPSTPAPSPIPQPAPRPRPKKPRKPRLIQ